MDNEIETKEKAKEIKFIIEHDQELNLEYQLQNFVKSTLKSRLLKVETPEYLKLKIINNIINDIESTGKKKARLRFIQTVFKPAFALLVLVIVIVAIFFFSQNDLYKNIALQQKGSSNMFYQAVQNFQNIIEGNLSAQISPATVEELKTLFRNRGMNYDVPSAKEWRLTGAAISEIGGKKLAHNIYRNTSGKIAYLYQANEDFLVKQKILALSDDLIRMINDGKCFKYIDSQKAVMVWKCKNNICILVSNDRMDNLNQFSASR